MSNLQDVKIKINQALQLFLNKTTVNVKVQYYICSIQGVRRKVYNVLYYVLQYVRLNG